jgi:hypothetical protein
VRWGPSQNLGSVDSLLSSCKCYSAVFFSVLRRSQLVLFFIEFNVCMLCVCCVYAVCMLCVCYVYVVCRLCVCFHVACVVALLSSYQVFANSTS